MDGQGKRQQWRDHWSIHTASDNGYDESPVTPKASNNFVTEEENGPMPNPSGARIAPAAPATPAAPAAPSLTQGHYRVGVEATDGPEGVVAGTPFAQRLSGGNQLEQSCWNKSSGRRQEYQLSQPSVLARYPPKDFLRASDQLCQAPNGSGGGTAQALNPHTSPEVHEVPVCASRNHPEPPAHLHHGPVLNAPRDSALHQALQNSTNTVSSKGYQVPTDTVDGLASASQGKQLPPHLRGRLRDGPTAALPPVPSSHDAPTAAPCSGATSVIRHTSPVGGQDIPSAVGIAPKPLQSSGATFNTQQNTEHQHKLVTHEQAQQPTNVPKHPGAFQEVIQHFPLESSPKLSKEASAENASAAGWNPTDRPETSLYGASSASTYRSLGSGLVFEDDSIVPPSTGREAYDPTAPSDLRWGLPAEQPVEQDWNVTRPPRRQVIQSDPELSGSEDSDGNFQLHIPSFLRRWILGWAQGAPREIKTSFLKETGHWRCDVDTYSGCLIPPVVYPATKRHPRDTVGYQPGYGLTSTIRINAKCKRLEKIETAKRRKLAKQQDIQNRIEMARLKEENQKHMERFRCRIECHLRPAQKEDMSDVAAIYNDEVRNGWRALDQEPVPAEKFRNILAVTHRQGLPFFVALSGWRDPNVPVADAGHKVIGFAFVDIAGRGIIGSTETHSETLRLYVVVERESRRNRVGTAMIDAVLQLVSPQYIAKERAYQFVNPHKNPIYRAIPQNPEVRPWRSVVLEVYVENLREKKLTEKGTEYQAVWNWLEEDHRMMLINHLEMCSKASHLSDQWLDRLLFEHKCRNPTSMAGE